MHIIRANGNHYTAISVNTANSTGIATAAEPPQSAEHPFQLDAKPAEA